MLNNAFVVAGGGGEQSTESCELNDETDKFDCVEITPVLDDYYLGVTFAVPNDFCV